MRKKLSEFVQDENTTGEKQKEIERSIIKKFRKESGESSRKESENTI